MRALTGPACLAVLPLLVWPGLSQPFSLPKVGWIAVVALLLLAWPSSVRWSALPRALRWCAGLWVLSFVVSALRADLPALVPLVLGLAAPGLAAGVLRTGVAPIAVATGMVAGATTTAAIALLQWVGVDPFALAGWHAPIDGASVRMKVYGTLGNPNFVGALMAMSLPLVAAIERCATRPGARRLAVVALVLQALAIVATGSRGAVLGLGAAVVVYAWLRWSQRVRIAVGALLAFCAVAVAVSPGRPLQTTAEGRLHLWRIVGPQAAAAPATGQGPGSVPLRFPDWQREAARRGVRDARFAGLTDHVHNDYLEALVERGVPGLIATLLPIGLLAVAALRLRRPAPPLAAGAIAAVAAGAACALVDFPLARPAELTWWWTSVALAFAAVSRQPAIDPTG